MKIQYLGTAASEGIPAMFCNCDVCIKAKELGGKEIRTRPQAIIDDKLLIDFPPDSYMHMLNYNLHLPNIHHLLITHSHEDHFYPKDIHLRGGVFASKIDGILNIYGSDKVKEKWDSYMSEVGWDIVSYVKFTQVNNFSEFKAGEYLVTPIPATHDFSQNCQIYLIKKDGKTLLFANDTGLLSDESINFLKSEKIDLLSLDCGGGKFKEGKEHMGIPDNIITYNMLKEYGSITDKTKVVLTHFSHNGELLHDEIINTVKDYGFIVAYDGFTVEY